MGSRPSAGVRRIGSLAVSDVRLGPAGAVLALLALIASGCTAAIDGRQARMCRIAAAGLFDPLTPRLIAEATLSRAQGRASGVLVDIETTEDQGRHSLECRFATESPTEPRDLLGIRMDGAELSEPRLFMLKRFWLGTPEAAESDPMIKERTRGLPSIPLGLAIPLQSLLAALPNAAVYALLAATYSLVYGLSGRINLAFGEIAGVGGLAALIGATVEASRPASLIVLGACALAIWAAGLHGALIERLVIWPLRRSTGQQGLVATIGLALALQEHLRLVGTGQAKYIPPLLSGSVAILRAEDFVVTVTPLSLIVFALALTVSLLILALLRGTRFGRDWRATSDDPGAAALFGVDPRRLSLQTFVLACGLAGLAGACVTLISGSVGVAYTTTLGLKALVAAIVGGIGSVQGAVLGGLAIAVMEAAWSTYFPVEYRDLVIDMLLVVMLILRPGGLFGYRDLLPRRV